MKLALGTVQFGLPYGIANRIGQVSVQEAANMLRLAAESGIDTLDTAIAYGDSEACLGEAGIEGFRIVTKLPAVPEGCGDVRAWAFGQFEASLKRLGASEVDGVLLHRPEQLLSPFGRDLYSAMAELKGEGRVQKIGVSIYAPSELDALCGTFSFDLVQAPFNLIDRRLFESGWMKRLKEAGTEIHVRSAFLQGLLLMSENQRPAKFRAWERLWAVCDSWLASSGLTPLQACLAFVLGFDDVDRVVVGADSSGQLREIIEAAQTANVSQFPDIGCSDEQLVNPSKWAEL